ncbi:alkaline phosphatase family protein [bacterium]|nr:MAG: alkaline phosphatase family protein [bacterium]QQR61476.1 MAG: alkaline phosphatase family protein [bacterium]QQR62998.1 MAG: alkaline phosphatase family protein [bacterium]
MGNIGNNKKFKLSVRVKLSVLVLFFLHSLFFHANEAPAPKLTVILVIDQFAAHLLQKVRPFVKHGFQSLLKNGIIYEHAFVPYGIPTTAPGHCSLNTGTTPSNHGIVSNTWRSRQQNVAADQDQNYPTFFNEADGRSPVNIVLEGISDSFARMSTPADPHYVFSVAGKSRSAICTANKLGKALWFDQDKGLFTSSRFYFNEFPQWVNDFNKKEDFYHENKSITWKSVFPLDHVAYKYVVNNGYDHTILKKSLINTTFKPNHMIHKKHDDLNKAYAYLELTPQINQHLFDLAFQTVQYHLKQKKRGRMLLWVCVSATDKIGHLMGPESYETFDMLYHLDRQFGAFMKQIKRTIGLQNTLFVLTADHGIASIPELAKGRGHVHAQRINKKVLKTEINEFIEEKYGIVNCCTDVQAANVYLNLIESESKKNTVIHAVKRFLLSKKYIRNAWSYYELVTTPMVPGSIEALFRNQIFLNRSGDIIFQIAPHCLIDDKKTGTAHDTPYSDNTHVPLILYQQGVYEQKTVIDRVYFTQLANSLAHVLKVPAPDASTMPILPKLKPFWQD